MKLRYWAIVWPHQMQEGSQFKPSVNAEPREPAQGTKQITFEIDVPDDLFGDIQVAAGNVEEVKP